LLIGKKGVMYNLPSQFGFLFAEAADAPLQKTRPFRLWITHLNHCMIL